MTSALPTSRLGDQRLLAWPGTERKTLSRAGQLPRDRKASEALLSESPVVSTLRELTRKEPRLRRAGEARRAVLRAPDGDVAAAFAVGHVYIGRVLRVSEQPRPVGLVEAMGRGKDAGPCQARPSRERKTTVDSSRRS